MKFLITGAAGFIGFHIAKVILGDVNNQVWGVDNLNDYYDVSLKNARLAEINDNPNFTFINSDICDKSTLDELFSEFEFDYVIHLAAQAGVRYSLDNPSAYAESNLVGFLNLLECCRWHKIKHLVYASSSSVYGLNEKTPFSTKDTVDHPVSLYAATKKANELMAHSYAHLYGIPTTGLRFFTVYGPWGRPDMALFKFTQKILNNEPIDIYNNGTLSRDFTYIDDIAEGIVRIMDVIPKRNEDWNVESGSPATSSAPYRIYNIGNGSPVKLMEFVTALENALEIEAKKNFLPMQPGDVYQTWADTEDFFSTTGYRPKVGVNEGVARFVEWYRNFYRC
ncbi:NAD-dependent epimerase [Pectobacterium brasiliense]|uniref:NAD-dependent epimerase n=1 Tax=Pectobacterium brasiliense TaxID=180957 RepID=A0AAW9HFN6_9GAMM|nr:MULTISPECIES: NAD-dependent epimerase [Pectobacterium]MDY4380627.1 NAD-dependent epimerase [Pectobacterium brasiliense]UUE35074.1 NAD-dependent epimerase [Pectobacterium aroidearum]UUE39452.1 NAD-dependent epimerase [Pectobacterium aroidearum]